MLFFKKFIVILSKISVSYSLKYELFTEILLYTSPFGKLIFDIIKLLFIGFETLYSISFFLNFSSLVGIYSKIISPYLNFSIS